MSDGGLRAPVTFLPAGATVWVERGATVLAAARRAGVAITATCGGRGTCGTCGVRVVEGSLSDPLGDELAMVSRAPAGTRLACRAGVTGPVSVRVLGDSTVETTVEAGESSDEPLVAGVDVGTTSVAARVVGASSGVEAGYALVPNAQMSFGADVVSRLAAAVSGDLAALEAAAVGSVSAAIEAATGGRTHAVAQVVIACNPAMSALLTGTDPSTLTRHPFEFPAGADEAAPHGALAGAVPGAAVHLVPPAAGFVGGDAVAGAFATGMFEGGDPVLLVDVGTNAEVVLAARGSVWAASAPAGPAFEGEGISSGGPAVAGAVVQVSIAGDSVELRTIGDAAPTWLSGAGLVSAVAALRASGHVDESGLLIEEGPLRTRFFRDDAGVLHVNLDEAASITLGQLDVRAFQLAKAAVRTAIGGVLKASWSKPAGIARVLVAGAFGAALDEEDLIELGVLPHAVRGRVEAVGNAALAGAVALALDAAANGGALEELRAEASRIEHVDLASDPGFNDALMGALELAPY